MATSATFDSVAPGEYDESLYRVQAIAEPLDGWERWSDAHDDQYRALGFLSVNRAYTEAEVQAAREGLLWLVAGNGGEKVMLQFEYGADRAAVDLPVEERQDYVRKLMAFVSVEPRLRAMAEHPELLRHVRRLLGAEPELYQDMALFKPPGFGREKPWHQDHAYFNVPEGTPIVGVWIALDDATVDNGGMVFAAGGHREGAIPHWNRRDWQICDADALAYGTKVGAPINAGGLLIFDGLVPHGTPANRTDRRRRAVQYHFIPRGTPRIEQEERMRLFGSEGRDVAC
jgi:phytanoyl-CoA hydroxylase